MTISNYGTITFFAAGNAGFELPEEDRDDPVVTDLPHLPPDKDPQAQTLTRPQPKKKGQEKEMVGKQARALHVQPRNDSGVYTFPRGFSSWLPDVCGVKDLWCSSTAWLLSAQIRMNVEAPIYIRLAAAANYSFSIIH